MPDGGLNETLHVTCHEVGVLLEAAFAGRLQAATLDMMAARFPKAAVMYFREDPAQQGGWGVLHRGLGGMAMPALPLHLARDAPLARAHRQRPVGAVFHDTALMERASFRASAFFRDWLAQAGDFDAATGVVISRDGPVQTVLEIRYPAHAARQIAPAAESFLAECAPHLGHATRLAALAQEAGLAQREARISLELCAFPTFLLGPDCRIHKMNGRAEAALRNGAGLILGMDHRLQARDPDDTARLQEAVARHSLTPSARSSLLRLTGPRPKAPDLLSLTPLAALGRAEAPIADGAEAGRIAVMLIEGAQHLRLGRETLWEVFDLSAREVELAQSLLAGQSLPEMAQRCAVSKQTLRNQLASIMRKTGTGRQSELVALLLQMARALPL